MNSRYILRTCNKLLGPLFSRGSGTYKIVKRPDPKSLKMPAPGSAPKIMDIIKEKIRLNGPMTVAEYMHIVITNPTEGYYLKKEVIGGAGDFITSPEITQLFGEILGIWFYSETQKMGTGKPLQLVELGPGKATLLVDMLRVLGRVGYDARTLSLHLVEISETMQLAQATRLCISHRPMEVDSPHYYEGETVSGMKVYWYNDLKKVPNNFSWYIAHEFFDVLPIHKFEKTEKGWREVLIDLDSAGKLRYRISAEETNSVRTLIRPPLDTGERTHLEISARSLGIARQLAQRVDEFGGIALIADYGHEGEKGDTFRAFHKHKVVDPLENPGDSDLTADVDFKQLRIAASKSPTAENYAIVVGPVKQMDFLKRSQAELRLQVLLENAKTDEAKEQLKSAYEMLIDPKKMGERFKFMAFYPSMMGDILEKYPPLGFSTPKTTS
ncbi:protein arginine methyltransferase NDUFAF7 homolog, mitochondrial [Amyelois transitella]|uniref:protein arginine methyltransferase NDUFAF7 homolog, mitochondrial n=1 Tax=Amyelois transitella TaxID=680683 RepID=UPI00067B880F|nr:protein arginine methyltransferase NDUFAF7 homolog, mitochondrial [Amyelois transitella]